MLALALAALSDFWPPAPPVELEPAPPVELEPAPPVEFDAAPPVEFYTAPPVVLWNLAWIDPTKANEAMIWVNCIIDYVYMWWLVKKCL